MKKAVAAEVVAAVAATAAEAEAEVGAAAETIRAGNLENKKVER